MNLLRYIQENCDEVWKKDQFVMTDHVEGASFGNELIRYENSFLVIEFVNERGHYTMEFISKVSRDKNHRYSIELLRQLITGENDLRPSLDDVNGSFLRTSLSELISRFEASMIDETRKELSILEKRRAKKLFG